MNTNEHLLNRLENAIEECWLIANRPEEDRDELLASHDKVLGLVSTCNAVKNFTQQERLIFDFLYDEASACCKKARRLAAINI